MMRLRVMMLVLRSSTMVMLGPVMMLGLMATSTTMMVLSR